MPEKRILLTVRATKDGVYGNYYYKGPIDSDQGYTPGEIFVVDATPYVVTDDKGKPVFELDDEGKKIPVLDANQKQKKDAQGKKLWKVKMATMFSSEWMERVADDTEVTYPDRPTWTIPDAYRVKKTKPVKTVPLPADLIQPEAMAVPASVTELETPEPAVAESVI